MALGNQPPPTGDMAGRRHGATTSDLLTDLQHETQARTASQIREWATIATWADHNTTTGPVGVATLIEGLVDTGIPIAGPGAPLVSEFGLMELIAVLGRSPDNGRTYVGHIIETAWRLPHIWQSVMTGRLTTWRAERIADLTCRLNLAAAAFVDRQLASVSAVGWAQLERLVDEAIARFDPDAADDRRQERHDHRRVDISDVDANGLLDIQATVDAADGRDLDHALTRRATLRRQLGDTDSLDVRRAKAVGDLARNDLELDLICADGDTGEVLAQSPGHKAVLNLHITDTTLTGDNPVGRWDTGNTRVPVNSEQIRDWLGSCASIIVRPVIDLADCAPVDSYEIPDRLRRRTIQRDHTCRFPHCSVAAERCDLDHHVAYDQGGPTCPCNLVPLCRRHHRAKTFSLWRYLTIAPAHYLWISPHRHVFHVGPDGTRTLDLPRAADTEP